MSTSVRGNLLDLEHIWQDAISPASEWQPRPAHLQLVWRAGLPYWHGLTAEDLAAMAEVHRQAQDLLQRQGVRLQWLAPQAGWYPLFYLKTETDYRAELPQPVGLTRLYPAYALVGIPRGLRPLFPRYDHRHTMADAAAHPPVKERWPGPGRLALRDFLVEGILAEQIAAWPWPETAETTLQPADFGYLAGLAVANAPWFSLNTNPPAKVPPPVKHLATALAKLDFYLFAAS